MTRPTLYVANILAVVLAMLAATGHSRRSLEARPIGARPIDTGLVVFEDDQVTPNRFAVRAFVPTESLSKKCLATLSESNFAIPGISVFCSPREFQGKEGVLFSAFFPQPIPSGLILSATIYQEDADEYGAPVFFCGPGVNC